MGHISAPRSVRRYGRSLCRDYHVDLGFCIRGSQCPYDHCPAAQVVVPYGWTNDPNQAPTIPKWTVNTDSGDKEAQLVSSADSKGIEDSTGQVSRAAGRSGKGKLVTTTPASVATLERLNHEKEKDKRERARASETQDIPLSKRMKRAQAVLGSSSQSQVPELTRRIRRASDLAHTSRPTASQPGDTRGGRKEDGEVLPYVTVSLLSNVSVVIRQAFVDSLITRWSEVLPRNQAIRKALDTESALLTEANDPTIYGSLRVARLQAAIKDIASMKQNQGNSKNDTNDAIT